MNRDEFIEFLARLVFDGLLTEDQAAELLREFDAGTLPPLWQLPLPPAQAVRDYDDELLVFALGALLGLLGRELAALPRRGTFARIGYADRVQEAFEANARLLAQRVTAGEMTVAEWQGEMLREMQSHLQQQAMLASGRPVLNARQQARIGEIVREQSAYLSRFADEMAARLGLGSPWAEGYTARRGAMYGGTGRALFFEETEAGLAGEGYGAGWVIHYVARGDQNTCGPCNHATGYYLVGTGPMPGQVCLGRDACRCTRELVYDLERYRALGGAG